MRTNLLAFAMLMPLAQALADCNPSLFAKPEGLMFEEHLK